MCDAADDGPLVLIADDAHWLDRSTLGVLTFIARRLESEPVALVAAVREGYATPLDDAGLPYLELERLTPSAAAELLDRSAPDLHPVVRARVLAEAAGNPLALVELARARCLGTPVRDRFRSGAPTLTARLERAFAARLDDLPEETRVVLLAAALDSRASLEEVLEVRRSFMSGPSRSRRSTRPSRQDSSEVVGTEVRFRHPLIRSAVQQAALPAQVLAMYGALAEVVADPERRLWHRAMSAVGSTRRSPALEEHAAAARRRGAVMAAAAALERAAALTADPQRRASGWCVPPRSPTSSALVDVVRRLLEQAEPLEVGSLEAARLAWLQQMISGDVWLEPGAAKTFVTIARQMRDGGDADMALRSLVPIAHRCWWTRSRRERGSTSSTRPRAPASPTTIHACLRSSRSHIPS